MNNKSIIDVFVEGARKGFKVNINSMLPNLVMAFVLIQALKVTGILTLLGNVCAPIMAIFGLPGEGIMVLFAAWLSMGGWRWCCCRPFYRRSSYPRSDCDTHARHLPDGRTSSIYGTLSRYSWRPGPFLCPIASDCYRKRSSRDACYAFPCLIPLNL